MGKHLWVKSCSISSRNADVVLSHILRMVIESCQNCEENAASICLKKPKPKPKPIQTKKTTTNNKKTNKKPLTLQNKDSLWKVLILNTCRCVLPSLCFLVTGYFLQAFAERWLLLLQVFPERRFKLWTFNNCEKLLIFFCF